MFKLEIEYIYFPLINKLIHQLLISSLVYLFSLLLTGPCFFSPSFSSWLWLVVRSHLRTVWPMERSSQQLRKRQPWQQRRRKEELSSLVGSKESWWVWCSWRNIKAAFLFYSSCDVTCDKTVFTHKIKCVCVCVLQIRCMLNIWGVMLFIRMSWIVGQAGIGQFENPSLT